MIRLVAVSPETIAEIRDALQIILGEADEIYRKVYHTPSILKSQVKRIDKLLPDVKFEGGGK